MLKAKAEGWRIVAMGFLVRLCWFSRCTRAGHEDGRNPTFGILLVELIQDGKPQPDRSCVLRAAVVVDQGNENAIRLVNGCLLVYQLIVAILESHCLLPQLAYFEEQLLGVSTDVAHQLCFFPI